MSVDHTRNENTSKLHLFPDLEAKKTGRAAGPRERRAGWQASASLRTFFGNHFFCFRAQLQLESARSSEVETTEEASRETRK